MKIYLASSWRNEQQESAVKYLRSLGHEVYDFKNPGTPDGGFGWSEIDPSWKSWSGPAFRDALNHPRARAGFAIDMAELALCDACVLLLPCGRSAHLELGYAKGAGKRAYVVLNGDHEPELMYKMCDAVFVDVFELAAHLGGR